MRKNRRVKKHMSVNTSVATHTGVIVLAAFVMVILNFLASSSCQHLSSQIGEKEKQLAQLEDAYNREEMRWEGMKTPEQLSAALRRHGLAMRPAHASQNVHINADGRPYLGQLAVQQARRREGGVATRGRQSRR